MLNFLKNISWFKVFLGLAIIIYLGILGWKEYQNKINKKNDLLKFCASEIFRKDNLWQRYNDADAYNRCREEFGI